MNKGPNIKLKSETANNSNYVSVLFAHFTEPNGLAKHRLDSSSRFLLVTFSNNLNGNLTFFSCLNVSRVLHLRNFRVLLTQSVKNL